MGVLEPLPFPILKTPPMIPLKQGRWEITKTGAVNSAPVRGYFRGQQPLPVPNWTLRKNGIVWMSIVPMELESLAPQNFFARGNVCVLGLGMGVLVYNLLLNKKVSSITVIERDPNVIAMIAEEARLNNWPGFDSVLIIEADALTWESSIRYDFVLADIWPQVGDSQLRGDLQNIYKNIPADLYAAWGMEIDFILWLHSKGIKRDAIYQRHWKEYSKDIGVPLIGCDVSWMAKLAFMAGVQYTHVAIEEGYL